MEGSWGWCRASQAGLDLLILNKTAPLRNAVTHNLSCFLVNMSRTASSSTDLHTTPHLILFSCEN